MTVTVSHAKVAIVADGPDPAEVQPSDWNAGHVVAGVTDEKAKVSSNDTTPGYLNGKLVAGSNVTFTENNDGANETLTIAASGSSGTAKVSSNDTTAGYLNGKLVAGSGVSLTENNDGGNETLTIAASGGGGGGGDFTATQARFEDDCFFFATTDRFAGNTGQINSGTGSGISSGGGTPLGNHPGLIQVSAGTTTTGRCALYGGDFYIGGGVVTFETVLALQILSDGTNTFTVRAGLIDSVTGDGSNGVFLRYTHSANSGRWLGVCRSAGSETTVDTTATATSINATSQSAALIRLGFTINAARSSVQFYVSGATAGAAVTGTIPTSSIDLGLNAGGIVCSAGTSFNRFLLLDYYSLQIDFTSRR